MEATHIYNMCQNLKTTTCKLDGGGGLQPMQDMGQFVNISWEVLRLPHMGAGPTATHISSPSPSSSASSSLQSSIALSASSALLCTSAKPETSST